jgi:hypothetical protein
VAIGGWDAPILNPFTEDGRSSGGGRAGGVEGVRVAGGRGCGFLLPGPVPMPKREAVSFSRPAGPVALPPCE